MLIHRGRGGLVALITFLCLMAAELYTRAQFHNDRYFQEHAWPRLAGFLLAALLVGWLSPPLPLKRDTQTAQPDWLVSSSSTAPGPSTRQETPVRTRFRPRLFRPTDSLFFIPARYWPPILCALGILAALIPADAFA